MDRPASRLYVHELADSGQTVFVGIRYVSRLHADWHLRAIFYNRMIHTPEEVAGGIREGDLSLQEAATGGASVKGTLRRRST